MCVENNANLCIYAIWLLSMYASNTQDQRKNKTTNEYERIERRTNRMNVECNGCVCILYKFGWNWNGVVSRRFGAFFIRLCLFFFFSHYSLEMSKKNRMHVRRTTVSQRTREMAFGRKKKIIFFVSIQSNVASLCNLFWLLRQKPIAMLHRKRQWLEFQLTKRLPFS